MGNANGREGGEDVVEDGGGGGGLGNGDLSGLAATRRLVPILVNNDRNGINVTNSNGIVSPPDHAPARSTSPLLFAPQVPVASLQRPDGLRAFSQTWQSESHGVVDQPLEKGIPTIITWNYGGNDVAVEGSWDNFATRKKLQRSGKDHSILVVLPSGIYHYKFIVDGEWRYIPDLPYVADEMGRVCNLLDVNDYVPENTDSAVEFDAPPSPESTYGQAFPTEEDFTKEPLGLPPQLHVTVLDEASSSSKPQHVMLNHLVMEKGWASESLVALGLTHRFQSKYVTVCLYKPLKS